MLTAAFQDLKSLLMVVGGTSSAIKRDFLIPQSAIRNPQSKGFTLIETIITLVVLSIAAVGVLSVFTTSIRGSANPLIINQAIQLAQGEMDQVMGEKLMNGFAASTLITGASVTCNTNMNMLAGFSCNRNIYYVAPTNLNTPAAAPPTDYKHVTVTITESTIGSVSMDTVIANY